MEQHDDLTIRSETPADYQATEALALAAFAPDLRVAELVRRLRASPSLIPELNLVAEINGVVAAHIMFSRAKMDSGYEVALLSPMGVKPDYQRRGIGSSLILHALDLLKQSDFPLVVVEGVPSYYPQFGFVLASRIGVHPPYEVLDTAWMSYTLPKYHDQVTGKVIYPEPFDFLHDET